MDYKCLNCNALPFETLGGYKRHMTVRHGGWDDTDIARVSGAVSDTGSVKEKMHAYAQTMPEDAAGINVGVEERASESADAVGAAASPAPPEPVGRRVRATPKKLKKLIAQIPEMAFKQNGIELDEEDKDAVEEAVEFLENIFGVEFLVPAAKYTVQSRFWAFVWAAGVIVLVFVKHKIGSLGAIFAEPHNGDNRTEGEREKP